MTLASALASGEFVLTAELSPPGRPDTEPVRSVARAFAGVVHAANVTDNQGATVKLSPLVAAATMLAEGLEPILQMTTRDRNLLAIQSDLLGASALGVPTVLALSGDPLVVGPYDGIANAVSDVDSVGLIGLIAAMNAGRLAAGEALEEPTAFRIAAAANPFTDRADKLEQKVEAGASLFQTNIVYDVDRFAAWFAPIVDAGIAERAPFLVGVTPPRSHAMLEFLQRHLPGVEVDRATFERMAGRAGEDAHAVGIEIAVEVITRVRAVPGVAGVHLMAPGWPAQAVPRVAARADLGPRRDTA